MADFVEVAGLEQIRPGAGSRFIVADKEMAIFNVDGTSAPSPIPVLTLAALWEWESWTARS